MNKPVDAIILAAGSSTRFGSDKRHLLLSGVVRNIISALGDELQQLLLVLKTSDRIQLEGFLQGIQHPGLQIVWNDQPQSGMGHSLALAAQQLQAPLAMVFLADMPDISATTVQAVLRQATPDTIVAPAYRGRRGHPVCFGQQYFAGLQQLHGDEGAKALVQQHKNQLCLVDVDDVGVLRDIDTPQDWQARHDWQPV